MSTTRRGFLKLLGIGTVAAPTLLKAALKKAPTVPPAVVTTGYMQVLSCGSSYVGFDPANYIGEGKWESCDNNAPWLKTDLEGNPEQWISNWNTGFSPTLSKYPLRFLE